jgi:hypothetical protein
VAEWRGSGLQSRANTSSIQPARYFVPPTQIIEQEHDMPRIIIHACGPNGAHGPFTLSERVTAADLESEHHAGQLIERIAWAITDAEAIEAGTAATDPNRSSEARGRAGQQRLPQSPRVGAFLSG